MIHKKQRGALPPALSLLRTAAPVRQKGHTMENIESVKERIYNALWANDVNTMLSMKSGDKAEFERRIDFCARLWLDGRRFTEAPEGDVLAMLHGVDVMFRGADCDEEAEMAALAAQLNAEFRQKNADRWLKTISRDDAQRIIDVLDSDPTYTHSGASVAYGGVTFTLYEFASRWNRANGAERAPYTVCVRPNDNDFSW